MKKNNFIEFKVSKKMISLLITAIAAIIGITTFSLTASAFPDPGFFSHGNEAPIIKATNLTVEKGEEFMDALLNSFTATDKEDGDLTSKVVITGDEYVDTYMRDEIYPITLTVTDSDHHTTSTIIYIMYI